jgi:hypothetical protein
MLLLQRGQYQKLPLPPVRFHRPSALWAIGRSPHMLNSVSQIAWRSSVETPQDLMRRNHCKRCKSEPQIAADVIFKIISRGLTTTRSAFVNEHIFFFLTPNTGLHNSGLSIVRIFKRLQRSGARVLPLCKNEERLREITGCARFWCDPSENSLKVIARPVKTSDASLDQRGREDRNL